MIKAILIDIDGVLLRHNSWFVEDFCKDYGEDAFPIMRDYCNGSETESCDRGLADPYQKIEPYLRRIGYAGSVEDFYELKNTHEAKGIDHAALERIKAINKEKVKCFIGSNQDHRRKEFLTKALNLETTVSEAYFSCDFNFVKPENEYWETAHKKIAKHVGGIQPGEILFFDDRQENTESASAYGFSVIQVRTENDLHEKLAEFVR